MTIEELRKYSRELQEKLFDLEQYQTTFRRLYGELSYLKYHHADSINIAEKEAELHQVKRQLKADHGIQPQTITTVKKKVDSELSTVARVLQRQEEQPDHISDQRLYLDHKHNHGRGQ